MIADPELLAIHAKAAFIPVPPDLRKYDSDKYVYWHVYTAMQLGRPVPDWTAPATNAQIISCIPEEEIYEITHHQILEKGFLSGVIKPQKSPYVYVARYILFCFVLLLFIFYFIG